jgi:hypothetical protein
MRHVLLALGLGLGLSAWAVIGQAEAFSWQPADIQNWSSHRFAGETHYRLIAIDGQDALHAQCEAGNASGLYQRQTIDLSETPILEWSWRVEQVLDGVDETTRRGDDYPARLYVVDEHRVLRWRTRALNYVWSSQQPVGADWPNAFARQAHMIAVRSGVPEETGWVRERRNVREDFRRYHGRELDEIQVVAIMTDCDNAGQAAEAWYGPIRFVPDD